MTIKDGRLKHLDYDEISIKATQGRGLKLNELSLLTGFGYDEVVRISKEPGFPLFLGKVIWQDFNLWRQLRLGLILPPNTYANPQPLDADKPGEQVQTNDLPGALPPKAARLLSQVE